MTVIRCFYALRAMIYPFVIPANAGIQVIRGALKEKAFNAGEIRLIFILGIPLERKSDSEKFWAFHNSSFIIHPCPMGAHQSPC